MSVSTIPEWQQLALYAVAAALALVVLFNIPFLGRIIRSLFSVAILAFMVFVLLQQAPYDPTLSRWTERLGLSTQQVVGDEVRIRLASDGHFWARVTINGNEQRMMIDSGATITALSAETARQAGVGKELAIAPVMLRTANGVVRADTGTVERLQIEGIEARNLKVVISPAFGGTSVLGMNFLSQLASWRVEKDTLVLVPAEAR
ncbi:MAG: retroviral-like aspartic protease family protein [Blastomonas sp.]|jgi:aspartyl protease family protein|uniref:retropepsin-like aspartic protease family protein n=1 Tax=unclassified Blastomonas TaxID=2626550 RepID=UPI0008371ED4|nr:retroviral-like aspartic protease family protein [Blastomonas sp.]MCH2238045.1 retroviral-like aspartic protease family protein [Blastomonas sp.]OHD02579.1 MAG: peptidase [Sphingopyxis sp. RIFCSPHIGHO2_01_FULL_65_24]